MSSFKSIFLFILLFKEERKVSINILKRSILNYFRETRLEEEEEKRKKLKDFFLELLIYTTKGFY